jgi:hypothetical protein
MAKNMSQEPNPRTTSPESKPAPTVGRLGVGVAGTPAAGGASTKWVEIDLTELYELGHIDMTAAKLLQKILDAYNLKYETILNYSPDVGVEYYMGDEKFKEEFSEAQGWQEEEKVIDEYAKQRGAIAIVWLFDGYESAYALIFGEE